MREGAESNRTSEACVCFLCPFALLLSPLVCIARERERERVEEVKTPKNS